MPAFFISETTKRVSIKFVIGESTPEIIEQILLSSVSVQNNPYFT
jgi:hypothetical protein